MGETHKFREDMKTEYKILAAKTQGKRPLSFGTDGKIVTNCTCKKFVVNVES
jgi:hypothetical protein